MPIQHKRVLSKDPNRNVGANKNKSMNKEFKNEYWYKQLDSHIKCYHSSSGHRKTILINRKNNFLYLVVTRVNFLTTKIWIEHINNIINEFDKNKFDIQRFCWLTEQKKYKRDFLKKLNNSIINK